MPKQYKPPTITNYEVIDIRARKPTPVLPEGVPVYDFKDGKLTVEYRTADGKPAQAPAPVLKPHGNTGRAMPTETREKIRETHMRNRLTQEQLIARLTALEQLVQEIHTKLLK